MASQQSSQQSVDNDERQQPQPAYDYGPVVRGQPNRPFVVVNQPNPKEFLEGPVHTQCGSCGAHVVSSTYYEYCCLFGIWVYLGDCTKDVVHVCPNCNAQLGRYKC